MMTDIEIAQSTPLCPIAEIAAKAGIPATAAEPYGSNKAKITEDFLRQREGKPQGKPCCHGQRQRKYPAFAR